MTTDSAQVASSLEPSLEMLLLVTAHRLAVELHDALAFEPVSTMQLMALGSMMRTSPVRTASALAAALGCSCSSATELVDRLVRDGLVERARDRADGRLRILVPTERAVRVVRYALEALAPCMESLTRAFDSDEKATLMTLLERLELGAEAHRRERILETIEMRAPHAPQRRPAIHVR